MKIVEYYKKPERKAVGLFLCLFVLIWCIAFVLDVANPKNGDEAFFLPDVICHVVYMIINYSIGVSAVALLVLPLRYAIPFRWPSMAMAYKTAFATLFGVWLLAIVSIVMFYPTLVGIERGAERYRNGGTDYRRYSCYEELPQDEFSELLVPRDAVDIRRIYDGGFKYLNCSISSEIDMEGLKGFSLLNDYHFEVCKEMPMWCPNDCVKKELVLDETDPSNYLYCLAQKRELGRAEISFVYDIKHRRLYGVYMFD